MFYIVCVLDFFFFNGCYIVWCVSNPHLVSRGHFRGETTNVDPVLALGAGGCGRWSVVQRRQLSWEYNNLCTVDQTHMTSICIIEQNHSHGRPSLCNTLVAYPLLGIRIAIALSNTVRVRFDNHFHFRIFKSWLKIRKLFADRWSNHETVKELCHSAPVHCQHRQHSLRINPFKICVSAWCASIVV